MAQQTTPNRVFGYHPELIYQLARRDLLARYKGSVFGFLWVVLIPLCMLVVYTVIFTRVFNARWPGAVEGDNHFAFMLFLGLILHGLLTECMQKAPALVLNEANLVKKVVFPLDVLAWTTVAQATLHALCSMLVLLCIILIAGYELHWTIVFLPLILVPFLMLVTAISWALSALGVYFRDLNQVMGLLSTLLLFVSPVFYPVESLPGPLQPYVYLNPLTLIIEQSRQVVILGEIPNWTTLALYALISVTAFIVAHRSFVKAQRGFADVL